MAETEDTNVAADDGTNTMLMYIAAGVVIYAVMLVTTLIQNIE